jgi:hypothetical protein
MGREGLAIKLNGWQRIGVILSVLWFVGFGVFMFEHEFSRHSDFQMWQLGNCSKIAEMGRQPLQPNDPTYSAKMAAVDRDLRNCSDRASNFFTDQVEHLGSLFGRRGYRRARLAARLDIRSLISLDFARFPEGVILPFRGCTVAPQAVRASLVLAAAIAHLPQLRGGQVPKLLDRHLVDPTSLCDPVLNVFRILVEHPFRRDPGRLACFG